MNRGFKFEDSDWRHHPDLQQSISKLHWETFVAPREEFNKSWVIEFYVNAPFHDDDDRVFIRNKYLDISAKAINNFFGVKRYVGQEELSELLTSLSDQALARSITRDGVLEYRGNSRNLILSRCLSRYAKVWSYIVGANIDPTTHYSDLTRERVIIVYCILNKKQIDIGAIIHKRIMDIAKTPESSLCFPCLISDFCRKIFINSYATDVMVIVTNNITRTIIEKRIKMPEPEEEPQAEVEPQAARADVGGDRSWADMYNAHYQRLKHLRAEERHRDSQYNTRGLYQHFNIPQNDFWDTPAMNFNLEGYVYDHLGNVIYYPPQSWQSCQMPGTEPEPEPEGEGDEEAGEEAEEEEEEEEEEEDKQEEGQDVEMVQDSEGSVEF